MFIRGIPATRARVHPENAASFANDAGAGMRIASKEKQIVPLQPLPTGTNLEQRLPGWAVKRRRNLGHLRDVLDSSYGALELSDARTVNKYVGKISSAADVARVSSKSMVQ